MLKKFEGWRTRTLGVVGVVLLAALIAAWVIIAVKTDAKWTDAVSGLIAFGALCIATAAWRETRRSADADHRSAGIAEAQEERLRYGWSVSLHPNGSHYELRNTGTTAAQAVELSGDFMRIGFRSSDGDGPVNIAAGEARAFQTLTSYSTGGAEMTIEWLPEGETERRTWRETVPPMPSRIKDHVQERRDDRIREEQQRHDDARDQRELILRLGDAYADWKADRDDSKKKLQVQLLVAALPPSIAREIGYEVDVARDVWGDGEYPFVFHVAAEDRAVIEPVQAEIELMWNMRQLAGYTVYGPIDAVGPNTEPRIWWAVKGYASRVRERESGERRLRRSRSDQEHRDRAMQQLQRFAQENPTPSRDPA
ncbi:hypothetical protein ACT17_29915 [Mycolicibacterium conceptionense]|uniref:Uncharacterized protein n=1 Tax=Mycolicibacterium conceptionense TaxID=451644 RepID=A0A0J8WN88_9MYCO|nr:hypothetical protein [Mycolicibacterium conceptionense]KMV14514.1 hypothetical protein ACT17_29915 [Mycolicibacterium conceptionense]